MKWRYSPLRSILSHLQNPLSSANWSSGISWQSPKAASWYRVRFVSSSLPLPPMRTHWVPSRQKRVVLHWAQAVALKQLRHPAIPMVQLPLRRTRLGAHRTQMPDWYSRQSKASVTESNRAINTASLMVSGIFDIISKSKIPRRFSQTSQRSICFHYHSKNLQQGQQQFLLISKGFPQSKGASCSFGIMDIGRAEERCALRECGSGGWLANVWGWAGAGNEIILIIKMRTSLFLLAALVLSVKAITRANSNTWQNSLCIDCSTTFSSTMCLTCFSSGCSPYSTLDSSTGQCYCNPGYYLNNGNSNALYCGRCFIGCKTCTGPEANSCLTCAANFTFSSNTSSCLAPSTASDYTLQQAYYFLGFNANANWSPTGVISCSQTTLLGLNSGTYTFDFSFLKPHFAVRLMFAHYLQVSAGGSANTSIGIGYDGTVTNTPIIANLTRSNTPTYNCGTAMTFIQTYVDSSAVHTATNITITINTGGLTFALREVFVIVKLCNGVCNSCNGYYTSSCTACADSNRLANVITPTTNFSGTCVCVGNYYQEPMAGACVTMCPALPVETFGDDHTRTCVANCPNNTYAFTDSYRCLTDCPTTSSVSGSLLFKDKINWRCVANCPSQAPYACKDANYTACYALCPNTTNTVNQTVNYFAVNGMFPECVSVCPYNSSFWTFGYQGNCIPRCPSGTWGDPFTKLCLPNCTNNLFLYKDSSSGLNICVYNCTDLNYFRDNTTYTCVLTCPSTLFGETTRECVTRCANGSFGLPFGNRKCVAFCPQGWWGEPDSNVCVNITQKCKTNTTNSTGYQRYADNSTRTCVFPWQCSFGYFADNSTQNCVPQCPTAPTPAYVSGASVGYINFVCQITCQPPYFADYVAGLCVLDCLTNNTYSDVSSGRTCVTACNPAGLTPWADNNTWTCVNNCNGTGIANFVSDNSTFSCVYYCPPNSYADRITTNNPTCRLTCINNTYADNSTGTGLCSWGCSVYPPRFGDPTGGLNLCVPICTAPLFGDTTGLRLCVSQCPANYYSQNDTTRQCVSRCNPGSYASGYSCLLNPKDCPAGQFANDATNLCDYCSAALGTWGDPVSKRCVTICPLNPAYNSSTPATSPMTYYADVSIQQCVLICNNTYNVMSYTGMFGNNNTRSCVFKCTDFNSYAKIPAAGGIRVCVDRCYPYNYFANNQTRICVTSINCPTNQFGENSTQTCVSACPTGSWAYATANDRLCVDICPLTWYADNTTSLNICVLNCPAIPSQFADSTTKNCVAQCPIASGVTYYADLTTRTCVTSCPLPYFAYTPNRTCLLVCPSGYYGLNSTVAGVTSGTCVTPSSACGSLVGDPFLNLCVSLCTGPTPVSLFAYGPDCIPVCPPTYYSNTHNGVRDCVQFCPPGTIDTVAAPNLYGDNQTMSCVSRCVSPLHWADPHTRLCQPVCSATANPPLYSQNFGYTCVSALNCPISPSMTFGDNNTRSCVANCSLGTFGDPVSRSCLTQCQNLSTTGISTFYSDISTGQYLCVTICPELPALFGLNTTNKCVSQCPPPLYGDQTANRTCLPICPIVGGVVYFAQNFSRICVTMCMTGTWGKTSYQECVETPFNCSTEWADNSTNMCVGTCPANVDTYADPTSGFCVPLCPNTPNKTFSDSSTRKCVQRCPDSVDFDGTFGNNQTRVCEDYCSPFSNGSILTYADPQTLNRYCVLQCSQSPNPAFADPSTRTCVPICPATPNLFGETVTFTCVASCTNGTFADSSTRLCGVNCTGGQFRLTNPSQCVSICPADQAVPLYGDPNNGNCVATCTNNYFRYKTTSMCVSSCTNYNLFSYNMTCVDFCPQGYYANSLDICVTPCPNNTFGENSTTTCQGTCLTGYAYNSLCIAVCPNGYYGEDFKCVTSCQISGNSASNLTNTCISTCTNGTYAQSGACSPNCTFGTYADSLTNTCSGSCSGSLYYGSPLTSTCVTQCPPSYYINGGYCSTTCTGSNFADNVTWSCTPMCSTGYWGYNNICLTACPTNYYGYISDRICYSIATFPTSIVWFANNITQTWESVCPLNPLTFGDRTLRYCIPNCLGSTLADPMTRQCETSCRNASYANYFADFVNNKCVLVCPPGYFANSNNNKCEGICTTGYAYGLDLTCVSTCPAPYSGYNNNTARICVLQCPINYYSFNRVCGTGCTSPYYADNNTNQCVLTCINSFASDDVHVCVPSCAIYPLFRISDNSTNTCVNICPSDPDYYSENNVCVLACSLGKFADPTPGVRICTTLCTTGLFSNPLSGRCEPACPTGYWGQNITNKCEPVCSVGFADNATGLCVTECPTPTFADSTTARCVKTCPWNYFGEVNNTCVQKCTLPNYANPLTVKCEPQCPAFNYSFAENNSASCVSTCANISNSYADRNINACVSNCTLPNEYMLDGLAICTSLCPEGLFMENSTKRCQTTCTTGFAEPTTRYCVAQCFGNPQTYGYQGVCYYSCLNATHNLYADNQTNLCVSTCPTNFSDPLSGNCVSWCPDGYFSETYNRTCTLRCVFGFADNLTRSCVSLCPTDTEQTYADPSTKRCVRICPDHTFAENSSQSCVSPCPNNTWSDVVSKYCVARCPSEPLTFGWNETNTCVDRCPLGLFGDFETQTCLSSCPASIDGEYRFADPVSQRCVFVCPIDQGLYGDTANYSCVTTCTGTQSRDNSTQRCVDTCPSQPSYWSNPDKQCVYYCPPSYFASNQADRKCVLGCQAYFTFGDINNKVCTSVCPQNYWANNHTYMCTDTCPISPDYYADNVTRSCVLYCPNASSWVTFADRTTRRCVTECPEGYFAVNSTQRCETGCPPGEYADPIIRVCVQDCTVRPHYYKKPGGKCVFQCPTTTPVAYKLNTDHTCVYTNTTTGFTGCPPSYWADPTNNTCTQLCPDTYFADQVKSLCVKTCPLGVYADPVDRLCKLNCSSSPEEYRVNITTGICVQFCPPPYYADNSTYNCVTVCPNATNLTYSYEITRTCVLNCPPPYYSYLPNNTCILGCPGIYFAQDSTGSCELTCLPPYFADDSTNRCVLMCPSDPVYYGLNQVCRSGCPPGTYADNSTRLCVTQCPTQPQTFADNSTHKCVFSCPSTQNFYANNLTMVCVSYCPLGLFADANTRTCTINCPSNLMTYADPTTYVCQPACPPPYFASDLTKECVLQCPNTPVKTYARTAGRLCVTTCPNGTYAENISRTCASDCSMNGSNPYLNPSAFADRTNNMCTSICPYGWFGDNFTLSCVLNCPNGSYADNYTRRCLLTCPGTERLYSDGSTWRCVTQCPTSSYGNDQNWTCITNCPPTVYGYKLDIAHLCIKECPSPYFAHVPSRTCLSDCGAGFFGDPVTRICTACPSVCPTCVSLSQCLTCNTTYYLAFGSCLNTCPSGIYANNATMSCVYAVSCPSGTFGNNDTSSCSRTCPSKQFADLTTKLCVLCPYTCATCTSATVCQDCITTAVYSNVTKQCYAFCSSLQIYNYNSSCYATCPKGTYLDYTNINCQSCNAICATCSLSSTNCTSCSNSYLFNLTCTNQCPTKYYGINSTCLPCTASVKACSSPLTFTVTTVVVNYQTVLIMKFSQQTVVKGDPSKYLSLNLKPSRLLQSGVVNGGVQFTTEVLPDGTIKIILAPGVTLSNPSFVISIDNPSMITTVSGDSIQSLQSSIENVAITNYPSGSTSDAPLVIAGTILAIFMLLLLGLTFVCTPLPVFLTLEAFQMIALYALVTQLPPNLFYFMKKLSLTRLSFLPNVFSGVYAPPSGYSSNIPTRVTEIDGALSFSLICGSYFFILLLYGFVSLIIYALTTKHNSNRPLRELFTKIYEIRVKWGILNDFLWMFSLNIFVCGFMQFRYTESGGDVALAVISLILFLGALIAHFVHHFKTFDPEDKEIVDNYHFLHEGVSEGRIYRYTTFIYYLRKLLFAIFVVAAISGGAKLQCILLISLSSLMLIFLVAVRPYQDKLRNIIHILHEIGLTFIGGAMLYYQHYLQIKEPVGTLIICGTIITYVIITHLSIAFIWGAFKAYTFYKQLYADFKKTEFFHLYLDQQYDDSIEKELQDLNDESGEVQSVELTNIAEDDNNEEENIIKLKIKRRRKVKKNNAPVDEQHPKIPRNQGDYIKLEHSFDEEILIKEKSSEKGSQKFERMNFQEINVPKRVEKQHENSWHEILQSNPSERPQSKHSAFEPIIDQELLSNSNNNEFEKISGGHLLDKSKSALQMQEISSVSNKEEKVSKEQGDQHLRESLLELSQPIPNKHEAIYEQDIFQMEEAPDGHEAIYSEQQEAIQPQQDQEQEQKQSQKQEVALQEGIVQEEVREEPEQQILSSMNHSEIPPAVQEAQSQRAEQPYQQMQQSSPSNLLNFEEDPQPQEEQSIKNEDWEELFDINQQRKKEKASHINNIGFEESQNRNEEQEMKEAKEVKAAPSEKISWSMDLQSLLQEEEKQKSKKKHLLLFDEQDFE